MECEKIKSLKNREFQIASLLIDKTLNAKELQNILKVDKATIYRNLKSLLNKKVIREIKNSEGIGFYELNCNIHNPIHPHFECRVCKRIFCLNSLSADDTISLLKYTPFTIEEIEIKFKGICDDCKKN